MNLQDQPFDPARGRGRAARARRRWRAGGGRGAAHRLHVEGQGAAARHGEGSGLSPAEVDDVIRGGEGTVAAQREWFEKDYYKVLGVAETASGEGDHQGVPEAGAGEPSRRQPRQRVGRGAVQGGLGGLRRARRRGQAQGVRRGPRASARWAAWVAPAASAPAGSPSTPARPASATCSATCSVAAAGAAAGAAPSGVGPQRGADVEATLSLTFEDAAHGLETTLHLTADAQCSTCPATAPGRAPRPSCARCAAAAASRPRTRASSRSRRRAATATAAASIIEYPCGNCRGSGVERRPREVKVRIPAGVADGQRIRLKHRGGPGRNGGPAGDLFVECHVAPHARFGRDGNNLTVRVPVTFPEAALGGEIDVPVLDGGTVKLRLKPGTQPGTASPREGPRHRDRRSTPAI